MLISVDMGCHHSKRDLFKNCLNAKAAHFYKQSTRGQVSKGVQIPKTKRGFFGIVTVFILSKFP